ncbi:ABC-type transport system permease protein (probable substrate biotin) [Natrialba magadii ATCC 43099]|uniref:ABC-type transport system permease protein (Probable substrate biotin) n=1 Tax=Natrialba magadii (strain ATCC 43099 / DSM 3394 / CCM 3739 / CIP 104546 / IAM 13178 / JCM 8861 / NBRC 102185 / NCIMB 2190 / MS3) TaxID=547559 RepID=D3T0B4_NATMM|nr:energy-coupling factor transporter transmembrane component T [Natrialba magadii]ADD04472.1 ABC-type transport system permease protein (probable substrate biotin) [Natrialba magadii ATCC 43099]ELY25867.1 cobalt transporter [Natrialba magadii ATCC 43099]
MLTYEPDDTLAHRLDPRSKLAIQIGFAATALSHTAPRALAVLTLVTLAILATARVRLLQTLYAYRFAFVFLGGAPLLASITLGPPWVDPSAGVDSLLASYRVLLILLVSAAYVRSTRVRDSRAAIQRTIPGKPGQLLGIGVALVFRFLPVLRADVKTIRDAMAARLGTERAAHERAGTIALLGLERAFDRADRLSLALQARCFAWNPTLPRLSFSRLDAPALGIALVLALSALL